MKRNKNLFMISKCLRWAAIGMSWQPMSRRMGWLPMQATGMPNRPISAQPEGQIPFRAACGVANPRHSGAMAAVCALHSIPKRYLRKPFEIMNRF
jgi:hypothetical protein